IAVGFPLFYSIFTGKPSRIRQFAAKNLAAAQLFAQSGRKKTRVYIIYVENSVEKVENFCKTGCSRLSVSTKACAKPELSAL
ncbi:MAG: hypothetical protein ACLSAP_08690, partial [Oscillospiraceae bacterium]